MRHHTMLYIFNAVYCKVRAPAVGLWPLKRALQTSCPAMPTPSHCQCQFRAWIMSAFSLSHLSFSKMKLMCFVPLPENLPACSFAPFLPRAPLFGVSYLLAAAHNYQSPPSGRLAFRIHHYPLLYSSTSLRIHYG